MDYLRSTAELLAVQLRTAIERGELTNPLPNIREWSRKLGVGRVTLGLALRKLAAQKIVVVRPRLGAEICSPRLRSPGKLRGQVRLVRTLYYGQAYPHLSLEPNWYLALSEQLQRHEIHLTLEKCSDARLRAISERGERPNEMFLLQSLHAEQQRRFTHWKHSILLAGYPAPGIKLRFLATDIPEIVRHATLMLIRHGFTKIGLMIGDTKSPGVHRTRAVFRATCAEWQRAPVRGEVIPVPLEIERMVLAIRRFVSRVVSRHGLIVVLPVSIPAILCGLWTRNIRVPEQVEIVAIESSPDMVRVCPSVSHYPFPQQQFVKTLAEAAVHYFEHGSLSPIHKCFLIEPVPSRR